MQGLKWQARAGALALLGQLAKRAPAEFAHCMVAVVPRVSECMVDIRQEVRAMHALLWHVLCMYG